MVRKLLLVVVLALLLGVTVIPAAAFTGGAATAYNFYCNGVDVSYDAIQVDRDNSGLGLEVSRLLITDGVGVVLLDSYAWNTVGSTILAHVGDFFPYANAAPTYNPIRVQLVSVGWNGFSEQQIWDFSGTCAGLPTAGGPPPVTALSGRGIPSNFVHRRIDCETPVYNLPGGQPVSSSAIIHNQQTWFVNPIPVDDLNGNSWTEIFNASYPNPYIPTSCVNPDPSVIVYKPNPR